MILDLNYLTVEYENNQDKNKLDLTCRNLNSIEKNIFKEYKFIKEIYLNKNNLFELKENTFRYLTNLIILDLSENNICHIDKLAFNGLTSLGMLNLKSNNFKLINKNVFKNLNNLKSLWLFDANSYFTPDFEQTSTELITSKNILEFVSKQDQEQLILNRDFLMDNYFYDTHALYGQNEIILNQYNSHRLITINRDAFQGLFNLKNLLVKAKINQIQQDSFIDLKNLLDLSLKGNRLQSVETDLFSGLLNLKSLDLSENLIEKISDSAFESLKSLKKLDLHENKLELMNAKTFTGLTSLEILNLRNNQLNSIEKNVFESLVSLEYLLLDSNNITFIDRKLFNCLKNNLKALGLSKNKFKSIDKTTFLNFKNLIYLSLFDRFEIRSFRFNFKIEANHININNVDDFIKETKVLTENYLDENFDRLETLIRIRLKVLKI